MPRGERPARAHGEQPRVLAQDLVGERHRVSDQTLLAEVETVCDQGALDRGLASIDESLAKALYAEYVGV